MLYKKFPVKAGDLDAADQFNKLHFTTGAFDVKRDPTFTAGAGKSKKQVPTRVTTADELKVYQKAVKLATLYAKAYQSAILKYISVSMKVLKVVNSQNRKIMAAAVAYNPKKDESVMIEAMMELAEYEQDVVYNY